MTDPAEVEEDGDKRQQGGRDARRDPTEDDPGRIASKQASPSQIQCYRLRSLSFHGPREGLEPYISLSILDPIITIERHRGKYHIAARFNLEITILNYENQTR